MKVGETIEAKVTSFDSSYKQVKGEVKEINKKQNRVLINATKVVSKWSDDDDWKDHPTSCVMSVSLDDVIVESTTNVLQDAYIAAYSNYLLNKAKDTADLMLIAKKNLIQGFIDWSESKGSNLKGATVDKFYNFGTPEMIGKIFRLSYDTIFTPIN